MLNFVLCDDNVPLMNSLENFLSSIFIKHNIDAQVIFHSTNPDEIIHYITEHQVDVLILDIDLKCRKNGLDLAKNLREFNKDLYLVFCTAYLDYIMASIKNKIFDYLVKPITYEKLENFVLRLKKDLDAVNHYIHFTPKLLLNYTDILYIEKRGIYCCIHLKNDVARFRGSLEQISKKLPDTFTRCHKSYIVNSENIRSIDYIGSFIKFGSNLKCPIGPKYKFNIAEVLNNARTYANIVNA